MRRVMGELCVGRRVGTMILMPIRQPYFRQIIQYIVDVPNNQIHIELWLLKPVADKGFSIRVLYNEAIRMVGITGTINGGDFFDNHPFACDKFVTNSTGITRTAIS